LLNDTKKLTQERIRHYKAIFSELLVPEDVNSNLIHNFAQRHTGIFLHTESFRPLLSVSGRSC